MPEAFDKICVTEASRLFGEKHVRVARFPGDCVLDPLVVEGSGALEMLAHHCHAFDPQGFSDLAFQCCDKAGDILASSQHFRADDNVARRAASLVADAGEKLGRVFSHDLRTVEFTEIIQNQVVMRAVCPQTDLWVDNDATVMAAQHILYGARSRFCGPNMKEKFSRQSGRSRGQVEGPGGPSCGGPEGSALVY